MRLERRSKVNHMRLRHALRRLTIRVQRFFRDTSAMDRRLNAAKHDPAVQMDADIEHLRDSGRINPF